MPSPPCSTGSSGASIIAATRGSFDWAGTCSLATSSDWTTTRAASPTASTSQLMAMIERWVSETSRVERTRTRCPDGAAHSTTRRSTPARRSSTRSWCRISP